LIWLNGSSGIGFEAVTTNNIGWFGGFLSVFNDVLVCGKILTL
jgi:hypothetical protein